MQNKPTCYIGYDVRNAHLMDFGQYRMLYKRKNLPLFLSPSQWLGQGLWVSERINRKCGRR